MHYKVCVSEGKAVNSERRTWVTIYITVKWDPEHVFLSVRVHDQLMDTQKLTCFHCAISCLFQTGHRLFCGLYLYFPISLICEVR